VFSDADDNVLLLGVVALASLSMIPALLAQTITHAKQELTDTLDVHLERLSKLEVEPHAVSHSNDVGKSSALLVHTHYYRHSLNCHDS